MYIRIFGHVYLHFGLVLMALFSLFSPMGTLYRQAFLFALIHEGFHCLAALWEGASIRRLELLPYGCALRLSPLSCTGEIHVAAAGPIGSFCLFLLFYLLHRPTLAHINLLLVCINLLPALPLDGGRLLRAFLWQTTGYIRGNRIARASSLLIGLLLLFTGFWGGGLFFAAAFLILSAAISTPPEISPLVLKKTAASSGVKHFTIDEKDSLLSLISYYSPFYHAVFHLRGKALPEAAVTAHIRKHGIAGKVRDIIS